MKKTAALLGLLALGSGIGSPSGFAPGYDIIAPGIPPKIYGMHHVRKGTLKRTNK